MTPEVHLVSVGGVTACGPTSLTNLAAFRAGINRFELFELEDGQTCHIAPSPSVAPDVRGVHRLRALLDLALRECAESLEHPLHCQVYLSSPHAGLLSRGAKIAGLSLGEIIESTSARGLVGLMAAVDALANGRIDAACVCGVDSLIDPEHLATLRAADRLMTESTPWGLIPGEGAASCLLVSERTRRAHGLKSLARIGPGLEERDANVVRGEPCTGRALSRACHAALSGLPSKTKVAEVYGDLTGERKRVDEWGYTLVRIAELCRDAAKTKTPALHWGDVGQAHGALTLLLAALELAHGTAAGAQALIWTSGDDGSRAAVLVEKTEVSAPHGRKLATHSRSQTAQTQNLIDELLSEASFAMEQAEGRRALRERHPEIGSTAHRRYQTRLDRQIEALTIVGAPALSRAVTNASESAEPAAVYAAIRLHLANRTPVETMLRYLCELDFGSETILEAVHAGLCHGGGPQAPELASAMTSQFGIPGVQICGLWLSGDLCIPSASEWAQLARLGPHVLGASLPWAVSHGGRAEARAWLEPWLASHDAVSAHAGAMAALRLDRHREMTRLLQSPRVEYLCALALAASDGEAPAVLAQCEQFAGDVRSTIALGLLGTLPAVKRLTDRLSDEAHGELAARSLFLITGRPLFEQVVVVSPLDDMALTITELEARAAGDTSVGIEREVVRRFAQDPNAWQAEYRDHLRTFSAGSRARLGRPHDAASEASVLVNPHISPSIQQLCAENLGITFRKTASVRSVPRICEYEQIGKELAHEG